MVDGLFILTHVDEGREKSLSCVLSCAAVNLFFFLPCKLRGDQQRSQAEHVMKFYASSAKQLFQAAFICLDLQHPGAVCLLSCTETPNIMTRPLGFLSP